MKLRVAILDHNAEFMDRLAKAFQQKYVDKISLSLFSSENTLYQNLKEFHEDMVLVDQSVKIKKEEIPEGVVAGYFSNIADINEIEGFPAIGKYQKIEIIYKMILSMYAENSSNVKVQDKNIDVKIILFTSVQGGSGTSTASVAYALRKASDRKKVFYLNLEKFGNTNLYFTGNEGLSFSDIIYSLKSKKGNLLMKLESVVQVDSSGVKFFNPCKNAYDMFELRDAEIESLIQGIAQVMECDEIIIDISGAMTERMTMLMADYADKIVYVSDGSLNGNEKFRRFCEAVRVIEQKKDCSILKKVNLLYNRFSSKTSTQLEKAAVSVIGGIHRFEGVSGRKLLEKVAQSEAIDMI